MGAEPLQPTHPVLLWQAGSPTALVLPALSRLPSYPRCAGCLYALFPHVPAQAYFFVGDAVPYPLPWRDAPFRTIITQEGLEESWPWVRRREGVRRRCRAKRAEQSWLAGCLTGDCKRSNCKR